MLKNFDDWDIYDGAAEGSGRSEKIWLEKDGITGVFKFPKKFTSTKGFVDETTKEYLSEKIASLIASEINIDSAKVDLGIRNGRIGSLSYNILKNNEILVEGIQFITNYRPNYNQETLYDYEFDEYYSLEMIENAIKKIGIEKIPLNFYKMLIFDFIIGNNDRHQNNWGFIVGLEKSERNLKIHIRFSPLYDNGSSLCSFIKENEIDKYINTKDQLVINSLIDTKSKSMIGIDSKMKKRPTQLEMIKYLKKMNNSDIIKYVKEVKSILNEENIFKIINSFDDNVISIKRKQLLKLYLNKKIELLNNIFLRKE